MFCCLRPEEVRAKSKMNGIPLTPVKRLNNEHDGGIRDSASRQRLLPNGDLSPNSHEGTPTQDPELGERGMPPMGHRSTINQGLENEMTIEGFSTVQWKLFLYYALGVCTAGLLWLVLYWVPRWKVLFCCQRVNLGEADLILVIDPYKGKYVRYYVKKVIKVSGNTAIPRANDNSQFRATQNYKYFKCQKLKYLWDPDMAVFYQVQGLDQGVYPAFYHQQEPFSREEQVKRRELYGTNQILVPQHSILALLFKEILNPFYVFQVASVTLWFADEYVAYATAIVLMSVIGITASVYQTKVNEKNLRSTIQSSDTVSVQRKNGNFERISTDDLVPGDIFEIPKHPSDLLCDAVLLTGSAIVNEAMLTGESVPVTKSVIPRHQSTAFDPKENARNTLFCGTKVIQTRTSSRDEKVLAMVIRTGYLTSKGGLVRSILYPAPVDFKFEQDSYKFIGFLALVATAGFLYTVIELVIEGESTVAEIALDALDLITIVVPPALPAAMTIGSIYALRRLKHKGIFCISPRTINVSGSVDIVCFDKTGTLTEDGLKLWGVVPLQDGKSDIFGQPETQPVSLKMTHPLIKGMAVTHSLTYIDGEPSGDPLDEIMFGASGWELAEASEQLDSLISTKVKPKKSPELSEQDLEALETSILQEYAFSSSRQCMSVVTKRIEENQLTLYCKGSPEKIARLSVKGSVPKDFRSRLASFTDRGYRVIALSKRSLPAKWKPLNIKRLERDDAEVDLEFLGLIVLENKLKKETTPIIKELNEAKIQTVMVTGDNLNTALSVAKECKIIKPDKRAIVVSGYLDADSTPHLTFVEQDSHSKEGSNGVSHVINVDPNKTLRDYCFAIDGLSFEVARKHFNDEFVKICAKGEVYARMSPEQKQQLVEQLQDIGYYVGMCGDGANDCGALKAAHAGISLSEAESSVASPFTSNEPNISCVPNLIREGRCALVTSFGIFKYMAAYSLTQFTSVLILYSLDSNLTDMQFLYIDLFLITTFALFFGHTRAYEGDLAPHPPMKSLISFSPILSLSLQMIVIIAFQVISLDLIQQQSWFVPFDSDNANYNGTEWEAYYNSTTIEDSESACWENYAIFTISSFQYIILAYVFSKSKPYRKFMFTNLYLTFSLIFMTGFTVYLVIDSNEYFQKHMELLLPPEMTFRWIMLGMAAINIVICVFLEDVIVEFVFFRWLRSILHDPNKSKRSYLRIQSTLAGQPNWPPLSSADTAITSSSSSESTSQRTSPVENLKIEVVKVENEDLAFDGFAASPTHKAASALNSSDTDIASQEVFYTPVHYATELNKVH